MDNLLTFMIEIGLLAGGILFLVLAIMALLPFPWYWLTTRRPVRMVLTDMTGQPIPANRRSLLLHQALEGLGFARIGVTGALWPWTRTPLPLRLLRSQDGRVVAQLMDTVGETQVGLESRLDDGFIVLTVFPDSLGYSDENIDTVGTMTSPAGAVDDHMARLLVAEADHGRARRFDDVADFIRVATESGGVSTLGYRRTGLRRGLRSSVALAAVFLGLVVVVTFQLLRVLDGEAGRPPAVTWTRIDPVTGGAHQLVNDVATIGDRFVAVGQIGDGVGGLRAAAWASADGQSWRLVLDEAPRPDAGVTNRFRAEIAIRSVANAGDGLISIGHEVTEGDNTVALGRVWRSADGMTWTTTGIVGLDGYPVDIAGDGSQLVAVGQVAPTELPEPPNSGGAVWTSADGRRWSRAPIPPLDFFDAIVHGQGGFVALGVADVGADESRTVVLHSVDARTWTDVGFPSRRADGRPEQLLALDDGYLAVGTVGVWRSVDGRAWDRVTDPLSMRDVWLHGVAAGDDYLVAVGERGDLLDSIPGAWTSLDGRRWGFAGELDPGRGIAPFHVAVAGNRAIVFALAGAWSGTIEPR